ncbi:hypothetical protein SAMN05216189_10123 [Pseudomonas delhiensis]|uniref:Uncharacterized protein n=1 Tax=Pseudomonas delhiensis TaxID=366289 RepID=A0A239MBP3_9PSED|nr:hypothetical protein SAMN05216189_10123 [Pseudomonas delhiensis]SNT39563.1 hypothetical protein SAMN06295949_1253 [Pseudomonas delhiensis]
MRHGCRESPDGLQGRTLGAGLRGGGIREGSPASSGPYAGQAFLVPFCGGGLPPFDKRDSPEGAKQETSEHSERRATPSPQANWVPAFAGMTRLRAECESKVREQARSYEEHLGAGARQLLLRTYLPAAAVPWIDAVPSPQPSPASGRGGCPAWAGNPASTCRSGPCPRFARRARSCMGMAPVDPAIADKVRYERISRQRLCLGSMSPPLPHGLRKVVAP